MVLARMFKEYDLINDVICMTSFKCLLRYVDYPSCLIRVFRLIRIIRNTLSIRTYYTLMYDQAGMFSK